MTEVALIMGSSSDWPKVKSAAALLKKFDIGYEVRVFSAHRTPKGLEKYVHQMEDQGCQVFLAAAGGAAHLAGVIASMTILPVVGIPVETNVAGGLDSLLSMVQMPGDIPVATVGIGSGGAKNAALLAVQMLALKDKELSDKLREYRTALVKKIEDMDAALQETIRSEGL